MEDQGERGPQTFLVKNVSFPQTQNKTISAFSSEFCIQIADLKTQLPGF